MLRSSLAPQASISNEAKNLAVIVFILTLLFSFIPSLVAYCWKKEDVFVLSAAKEALNWSITLLLLTCVLGWIPFLGGIFAGLLYVTNVVCCILAALNASKGLFYRFPFALCLIA